MSCGHHCSTTENNYTLLSFTPSLICFLSLCISEFLTAIILLPEEFILTCIEEQMGVFLGSLSWKAGGIPEGKTHSHTCGCPLWLWPQLLFTLQVDRTQSTICQDYHLSIPPGLWLVLHKSRFGYYLPVSWDLGVGWWLLCSLSSLKGSGRVVGTVCSNFHLL